MPASAAIAATVSGRSPEITFSSTPWAEELDRLACVRPQPLGEDDEAERPRALGIERPVRRREREHPPAAPRLLLGLLARAEHLRRPEDVARSAEPKRAPAPLRRERHLLGDGLRLARPLDADRLERRVPGRCARGVARERLLELVLGHARRGREPDDPQSGLCQGARLVEADDVDRGQRFDRVQLLGQRAVPRHPHRRDRVSDAREQDQAFRDERDDGGDGGRHGGVERRVPPPQRVAEHDAERDEHAREDDEQPVQRALERRARVAELLRLAGELDRVAVLAHGGDAVCPRALDREGARADLLAAAARDRRRLAGQDRLVDEQAFAPLERPVGDDLVARLEPDEISLDNLLDRDAALLAVADDEPGRSDERGEPVERPLRPYLLRDPDAGVRDEDDEEQRVLGVPEGERQHAEEEQDQVEEREDVGTDDARVRAARMGRSGRPRRQPPGGLLLGEPARRCGDRRHTVSVASDVGFDFARVDRHCRRLHQRSRHNLLTASLAKP